ncbi:MAG: TIGR04063 family PEP-CTERM/XrtA system glycosyltransferase [Alphaproteobacteria bacterium]
MRILHILDHSLPLQSGYVYRTLGIINQQRAIGWEPVLVTSGKHQTFAPATGAVPARERIGDWEFFRTPQPTGLAARLPATGELAIIRDLGRRLDEVIGEIRPDILHAHSPILNGLPTIRAARRHLLPVVYEIRAFWEDARASTNPANMNPGGKPDLRYHATRRLETFVVQRADAVTVICEGLARDIVARGIPADKVTIIPNAVDRAAFSGRGRPDPDLAGRLGLAGRTVIGFFGSFYFYEGLHLLLRAVPELRRRDREIAVLLAGGGPEEANLRKLATDLGLDSAVVFAGRVPHSDIRRYYDLADLLVFPRLSMRLTELVTPLKPLEAMAQERIVVASDVGGHRELIRDRETGYLFPPGDPRHVAEGIVAALDDRDAWPRVQARALHYVETERSWKHSVARYAAVYDRLMRSRQEAR